MPWNPGVQDQRGSLITAGARMANDNMATLGNWLSNFLEREKQVTAAGKSADFFMQANPKAMEEIGVHPDQWRNLSAREKASAVSGYVQSQTRKEAAQELQARMDEHAQRTTWLAEQTRALQQKRELEGDEAEALPVLFDSLRRTGGTGTSSSVGRPMPERMIAAVSEAGKMNPRLQTALARAVLPKLLESEMGAGKGFFSKEDLAKALPKGWERIVTGPNSSQAIYAGEDVGVPVPAHDEEGNLIGRMIKNAKGGTTFVAFKGNAKLAPARDAETGEILPGFYINPSDGRPIDARSGIEKLTGEGGGGGSAKDGEMARKVRVKSPNGKIGFIPESQKEAALKQGYTLVE